MKLRSLFATALIFTSLTAHAADLTVSKSIITWVGKKVTGQHSGTIDLASGKITTNAAGDFTGGEFVINMETIKNTDIADAEKNAKLIGHLKSDDFFGVDAHKTAKLKVTSVEKKSATQYKVAGELTIKGKTLPTSFDATYDAKKSHWTAKLVVDRTLYGIRYGSGKFFDDLGDKVIYDEFEVGIDLTATQK